MHDTSISTDRARRCAAPAPHACARVRGLVWSTALLAVCATAAGAATYYVDAANPGATDSGPGTLTTPYRTIQAAVSSRASAGNTIVVRPAIYRESVTISASGSSSNRIVLQAGAPGAVITGADDFSSTSRWSAVSGDVYLAADVTWAPLQVFADGARLSPSAVSPSALPARSFRYVPGTGLYVNAGGGNPGLRGCEVGRRSTGIFVAGASVTVDGLGVTRTEDRAIGVVAGGGNAEITNCTINFAYKYGIDVRSAAGVVLAGNRVSDNGDHGIFVYAATGTVIRDNRSFRNARPTTRAANGIDIDGSTGCTVERNRCYDNQDSGIQFYNGANDALSRNNLSWNNGDHGFDHVRSTGARHFHDVAWGNYKDGFSFEGSSTGGALFNCIAVDNGLNTGEFDLWVEGSSTSGFTSDYNVFWNSTSRSPVKFSDTQYAQISAYAAATGQDRNSRQLDPRFAGAASGDFRIGPGSPAIDAAHAGEPGWPATDHDGGARVDDPVIANTGAGVPTFADIGAYEYLPVILPPPAGNLCGNPGFEIGTSGWDPYGGAALVRVAGGRGGAYCLEARASGSSTFGIRDEPDWVATSLAAGTTYRFTAWVRSSASRGIARIKLREFNGGSQYGSSRYSPEVRLSSSWQLLTADITTERSGSTVDFEIRDYPETAGEIFQIDDVTIATLTPVAADNPPGVSAPASVTGIEGQPVTLNVLASDPDGDPIASLTVDVSALPAGHGAVFTRNPTNTAGTLTWTPTSSDGRTAPYTVTFTAANERASTATTAITVTDGGSAANLCGNPGFESGIAGWEPYGSATLNRVSGGRSGGYCMEIRASGSATIGMGDQPNWIDPVSSPGLRYRYSTWVRSASHRGTARLQIREFLNGALQGSAVLSPGVTLSSSWQQIAAEITTRRTGSVIETEVKDYPATSGEVFQIDDFSITRVGPEPALADRSGPLAASGARRFSAAISRNPARGPVALEFALTVPGMVRVQVFDVRGRQMFAPIEAARGVGRHRVTLAGDGAERLQPGAYFYRMSAPEGVTAGKFVILD